MKHMSMLVRIARKIAKTPEFVGQLPAIGYHGGNWDKHGGGIRGILPSGSQENAEFSTSWGSFQNVVNITFSREDAEDWMWASTHDLSEPGILYEIDMKKLDQMKFRPNDLAEQESDFPMEDDTWTPNKIVEFLNHDVKSGLTRDVISYEGPISGIAISAIWRYDDPDSEPVRVK